MHKQFLHSLDQELIRAGVWGRPAKMLKQELYDHFQTEKESLLKQGKAENEAEVLALDKLGSPSQLAQTAQMELDRRNGRFLPKLLLYLVTLGIFPLSWWLLAFILQWSRLLILPIVSHPLLFLKGHLWSTSLMFEYDNRATSIFFNWIAHLGVGPGLAIFLWLLRASFNPVRGWRYLLLTSAYLAFYFIYLNALMLYVFFVAFESHPKIITWFIIEVFSYCFLLLLTPWLVRAWKIHQTARLFETV